MEIIFSSVAFWMQKRQSLLHVNEKNKLGDLINIHYNCDGITSIIQARLLKL